MSLRRRLERLGRMLGAESHTDGAKELHVGDPRFDDWPVVRDFEDMGSARAWRDVLHERGVESALTADWPLDRFGRGDIALRVPNNAWIEASELLEAD